ncbi:MAG: cell division protein FtsQ/DivIB [Acutalibacteraceae bacterium]
MRTKQSKANREARAAGKARQVRSSALGKLIIMLAVVAAIVFGVAIFFKVNTIEIQGNTVYSADQIIEASQIQQGDNLLTVNKCAGRRQHQGRTAMRRGCFHRPPACRTALSFRSARALSPSHVMTDTNACWLVGPSGKALERIEPAAFNENPHINGLLLIPRPRWARAVSSPTPTALAAALDVLKELDGTRPAGAYPRDSMWKRNMT